MASYKIRDYYGSTITVQVDCLLEDHASAKCGVIFNEEGTHFISYTTSVITITRDGWLTCTGTYSQTTRKQIGWFLKEYAGNITYQDAKRAYERHEAINIFTRAWKSL